MRLFGDQISKQPTKVALAFLEVPFNKKLRQSFMLTSDLGSFNDIFSPYPGAPTSISCSSLSTPAARLQHVLNVVISRYHAVQAPEVRGFGPYCRVQEGLRRFYYEKTNLNGFIYQV